MKKVEYYFFKKMFHMITHLPPWNHLGSHQCVIHRVLGDCRGSFNAHNYLTRSPLTTGPSRVLLPLLRTIL